MKNKLVKLTVIATAEGLHSLEKGELDTSDRRLDGLPGTIGMELHADLKTAKLLERRVRKTLRRRGREAALQALDPYLKTWQVLMGNVSTGNRELDESIRGEMLSRQDVADSTFVRFPLLEN